VVVEIVRRLAELARRAGPGVGLWLWWSP
jgi:hypothetical protein